MAKKTVASLQTGKTDGRAYTKVIKMVKSPKTGAYCFLCHVAYSPITLISFQST